MGADQMKKVWAVADWIVSPLGNGSEINFDRVRKGESGVRDFVFPEIRDEVFKVSWIEEDLSVNGFTRFESLCARALQGILGRVKVDFDKTLFVLSTTKGNIESAGNGGVDTLSLSGSASRLAKHFGFKHSRVVSNACISGVLGLIVAKRFIQSGHFDHAVVVGADVVSQFVVSGFKSLQALSPEVCKPFDANRNGINLGEAAAAIVLTAEPDAAGGDYRVGFTGEGLSNDANHISGPSRTGEELALAISKAISIAKIKRTDVDFVSAHGTATLYNDEMEARAFFLAGLEGVPVNSLKSYFGHTLGAAGVLESAISIRSLINSEVIGTLGFETRGVSMPLKVTTKTQAWPIRKLVKTASGFGGCNAAIVFEK